MTLHGRSRLTALGPYTMGHAPEGGGHAPEGGRPRSPRPRQVRRRAALAHVHLVRDRAGDRGRRGRRRRLRPVSLWRGLGAATPHRSDTSGGPVQRRQHDADEWRHQRRSGRDPLGHRVGAPGGQEPAAHPLAPGRGQLGEGDADPAAVLDHRPVRPLRQRDPLDTGRLRRAAERHRADPARHADLLLHRRPGFHTASPADPWPAGLPSAPVHPRRLDPTAGRGRPPAGQLLLALEHPARRPHVPVDPGERERHHQGCGDGV